MRYRPIQAALRERVPITLWGPSRVRTLLAAVAASAAALVPTVMIATPAQAVGADYLTIADAANWEGGGLTFKFTYTGTTATSFTLSTVNGSSPVVNAAATGGGTIGVAVDYDNDTLTGSAALSGMVLSFPISSAANPSTATVTVATGADTDTADEDFRLVATDDNDSTVKTATGTIWALVADPSTNYFTLTGPGTVAETATTAGGVTTQKTVTITATTTSTQPHEVTIPVSTVADTAVSTGGANRDYTALASTASIVIPANANSGSTTVTLWDDNVDEDPVQTFSVDAGTVLGATAAAGGGGTVDVNITDDDSTPTVSIGNAGSTTEGGTLGFPVTLSNPSERLVTVRFDTADGENLDSSNAATSASGDYTAVVNRTVTFAAGSYATSNTVLVATADLPASTIEGPENLKGTISVPSNVLLGTPTTASGVISDSQAAPTATLANTGQTSAVAGGGNEKKYTEGQTGEVATKILVTLGSSSTIPVKIDYAFADGTAKNGVDYRGANGSLTIAAGQTTALIPVTIIGDTLWESPDETFDVVLSSPNNSIDTTSVGAQTITINDLVDVQPTWSIGNLSVAEGDTGATSAKVPITLTAATNQDTVFNVTLADGTATESGTNTGSTVGDNDYDAPVSRTVTIPAGSTSANVEIPINGDVVYERDETITVTPTMTSGNVSASIPTGAQHAATLTLTNNDAKPTVAFNETSGSEGTTLRVTGTIVGLSQYPYDIAIAFAGSSAAGGATAGTDYDGPAAVVPYSITRGQTGALPTKVYDVYLMPDNIDEPVESFTTTATETTSSLTGFTTSTGTYKINDDPADVPPATSVRDETINEDEGSVDVHVDLTAVGDTTSTQQTISIPYWTVDGSAKAGSDYASTKGTLSIAPGTTTAAIKVPIINDKLKEGAENFWLKLGTPTSPSGATIAKGNGEVIINANDGGSGEEPGEPGEPGGPSEPGAPTITAPDKIVGAVAVPIHGEAAAGAEVELWGAPMSGGDLEFITSVTADEDGQYAFSRWIGEGYRFATQANDLNSETVSVVVQQAPVFVANSPSRGKLYLAVQGNPRGAGQTVIVQRWVGGKWVNTWRGVTGSNNLWKVTVNQPSRTTQSLRAFVAGYTPDGLLPGYTTTHRVAIK